MPTKKVAKPTKKVSKSGRTRTSKVPPGDGLKDGEKRKQRFKDRNWLLGRKFTGTIQVREIVWSRYLKVNGVWEVVAVDEHRNMAQLKSGNAVASFPTDLLAQEDIEEVDGA